MDYSIYREGDRKVKKIYSLNILLILGMLCMPGLSSADVYIKYKRHTDAVKIMGLEKPEENVDEEIWITRKGYRSDDPKSSVIMLRYEPKVIRIDHREKTYVQRDLNKDELQIRITEGKDPEKTAAMKGMMGNMMKIEASVQTTDEQKKIGSWNCKKYFLSVKTFMGQFDNEIWATEDLKMDPVLYNQLTSLMISEFPGTDNPMKEVRAEINKIKGIQVKIISTRKILNQTRQSVTDLLEFKESKAPENILATPKGYKEKILPEQKINFPVLPSQPANHAGGKDAGASTVK